MAVRNIHCLVGRDMRKGDALGGIMGCRVGSVKRRLRYM